MQLHGVLACTIIIAVLVIKTALAEKRQAGSARRHWNFLFNRVALVAGLAMLAVMVLAVVATGSAWSNVAWALLAGLLTAFIADQLTGNERP